MADKNDRVGCALDDDDDDDDDAATDNSSLSSIISVGIGTTTGDDIGCGLDVVSAGLGNGEPTAVQ